MKFKALFFTINIVLILAFLSIFFLPLFLVSSSYVLPFWRHTFYFPLLALVVLAVINMIFAMNWTMLTLLEREDWPALAQYLERRVFESKRYSLRHARLLCDSLVLVGDFAAIDSLEALLAQNKPRLYRRLASRFAAIAVLTGKYSRSRDICAQALQNRTFLGGYPRAMLQLYQGLSLYLDRDLSAAMEVFLSLLQHTRDPLITAFVGYVLSRIGERRQSLAPAALSASVDAKKRLKAQFGSKQWIRYLDREKSDMEVVLLGKLADETTRWLLSE